MALGRDRLEAKQRAIQAIRSAVDVDRADAAKFRQIAAATEDLVDELAELESAGSITPAEASKRLADAASKASGALLNARQREAVAVKRERDIEKAEGEIAGILFDEQLVKTAKAVEEHLKAARVTPRGIAALLTVVRQAAAAAAVEAAARAELERLRSDGDERSIDFEDSPDWEGVDELIAFLKKGPPRPASELVRAAKRSAAALASTRAAQWSSAIRATSRDPVDEDALRARGYDDEIIEAVHREHDRLVRVHEEYEAANAGKFVRV